MNISTTKIGATKIGATKAHQINWLINGQRAARLTPTAKEHQISWSIKESLLLQ